MHQCFHSDVGYRHSSCTCGENFKWKAFPDSFYAFLSYYSSFLDWQILLTTISSLVCDKRLKCLDILPWSLILKKIYLQTTAPKNHLNYIIPFTLNINVNPLNKNSTAHLQSSFHIKKHLTSLLKKFCQMQIR